MTTMLDSSEKHTQHSSRLRPVLEGVFEHEAVILQAELIHFIVLAFACYVLLV